MRSASCCHPHSRHYFALSLRSRCETAGMLIWRCIVTERVSVGSRTAPADQVHRCRGMMGPSRWSVPEGGALLRYRIGELRPGTSLPSRALRPGGRYCQRCPPPSQRTLPHLLPSSDLCWVIHPQLASQPFLHVLSETSASGSESRCFCCPRERWRPGMWARSSCPSVTSRGLPLLLCCSRCWEDWSYGDVVERQQLHR